MCQVAGEGGEDAYGIICVFFSFTSSIDITSNMLKSWKTEPATQKSKLPLIGVKITTAITFTFNLIISLEKGKKKLNIEENIKRCRL